MSDTQIQGMPAPQSQDGAREAFAADTRQALETIQPTVQPELPASNVMTVPVGVTTAPEAPAYAPSPTALPPTEMPHYSDPAPSIDIEKADKKIEAESKERAEETYSNAIDGLKGLLPKMMSGEPLSQEDILYQDMCLAVINSTKRQQGIQSNGS